MKPLISGVALATLIFAIGAAPAPAGILYDNAGPSTGQTDAWGINFGNATANSFLLSNAAVVYGVEFVVWAHSGDSLTSVDWTIASAPSGGVTYAFGEGASTTQTLLFAPNVDGYDIDREGFSIPGLALPAGTYWLLLHNAVVGNGDHIYWDQSDGPSQAWNSDVGYMANNFACNEPCTVSETFQVVTPEPASLGLFGIGLIGMAMFRRRKVNMQAILSRAEKPLSSKR